MVLLDHASDSHMRIFGVNLNSAGGLGVQLFFVLSAFLLTSACCTAKPDDLEKLTYWARYAWRRIMRVFPLYALVLVVLAATQRIEWESVFPHLMLHEGERQMWSIGVEVKYYILLPFLAIGVLSAVRMRWWSAIVAAGVFVGSTALIFHWEEIWAPEENMWLSQNIQAFVVGSGIAFVSSLLLPWARSVRWLPRMWETCAWAALLLVLLRIPGIHHAFGMEKEALAFLDDNTTFCAILWPIVLLGVLHGSGALRWIFSFWPLRALGWISFSAYLWHREFLFIGKHHALPDYLSLPLYLLVVLAISTISYLLIERPLSRWEFPFKART